MLGNDTETLACERTEDTQGKHLGNVLPMAERWIINYARLGGYPAFMRPALQFRLDAHGLPVSECIYWPRNEWHCALESMVAPTGRRVGSHYDVIAVALNRSAQVHADPEGPIYALLIMVRRVGAAHVERLIARPVTRSVADPWGQVWQSKKLKHRHRLEVVARRSLQQRHDTEHQ
jgi:hypothetical protein